MRLAEVLLWISFVIIFYSYIGYGLLIYCITRFKRLFVPKMETDVHDWEPNVALIIPAYNEAEFVRRKIENTLQLDYPREKLSVTFITDGSTDATVDIIKEYPGITMMHQDERKGKCAAMNRAIQYTTEPVVIFCDANNLLNRDCIRAIAKHYSDPMVGGVSGEKKVVSTGNMQAVSAGEGLYWKYESLLKKLDSEFYSVVGAAGELFSLRTHLYEALPDNTIIEDFVLSLQVCLKGYRVAYEPGAFAIETASISIKDEQKRKIRISAGAFQAMYMLKPLFNFLKFPLLSFSYISHRVLRWTLCPLCLVILFLSNLALVLWNHGGYYRVFFALQVVFYFLGITGWIFANRNIRIRALYVPYYLLFMNISLFFGFKRFIDKSQSVLWEKSQRQKLA